MFTADVCTEAKGMNVVRSIIIAIVMLSLSLYGSVVDIEEDTAPDITPVPVVTASPTEAPQPTDEPLPLITPLPQLPLAGDAPPIPEETISPTASPAPQPTETPGVRPPIDMPVIPVTDGDVLTGSCGSGVMWTYSEGSLMISGSGMMSSCSSGAPWSSVASEIETISIGAGVQSIGAGAFSACSHLSSIRIPSSVETIGSGALPSGGYTVYCHQDSYAEEYAEMHGLTAVVESHVPGGAARETVIAPTNSSAGSYQNVTRCVICSGVLSSEQVVIPVRMPGDVNGDGVIDGRDLLRLMKYLDDDTTAINAYNADVTGDGEINAMDTLRLEKYLAEMDVTLE